MLPSRTRLQPISKAGAEASFRPVWLFCVSPPLALSPVALGVPRLTVGSAAPQALTLLSDAPPVTR